MKIAYFDCFSGISGNMILGALIDAGLDFDFLKEELAKLNLPGYKLECSKVKKSGLEGIYLKVETGKEKAHRHLPQIIDLIKNSSLSDSIKQKSIMIFDRLAEVEAKVHGRPKDQIGFHELGAVDTIIDVVGSVIGFEQLKIEEIHASALNLGSGTVDCSHGTLPIPAPATAELIKGIPIYSSQVKAELVTPTGAAILTTLAKSFGANPGMITDSIGYGAGSYDLESPNLLRVMIGEKVTIYEEDTLYLIETNIDDMNPQFYEHIINGLLKVGAVDAYVTPINMKKDRPAAKLSALVDPKKSQAVIDTIFNETSTLGVRIEEVRRKKLVREIKKIHTKFGEVRVKIASIGGEIKSIAPEYEDCRKLAEAQNIPIKEVYEEAKSSFNP